MSMPNQIPKSSDEDFIDESEDFIDEAEEDTIFSDIDAEDLTDPEYVEIITDDGEEIITSDEEEVISTPIIENKPDEKLTKEYERKLIKDLLHRDNIGLS